MPRIANNLLNVRERPGTVSPSVSRRNQPYRLTPWFWTPSPQNCEGVNFLPFEAPYFVVVYYGRPRKWVQTLQGRKPTLAQHYQPVHRPRSDTASSANHVSVSFLVQDPISPEHTLPALTTLLQPPSIWNNFTEFLICLSCPSILKSTGLLLCRMTLGLVPSDISFWSDLSRLSWQQHHRKDVGLFILQHIIIGPQWWH